jgi:cell division protein FtsL
VSRSSKSVNNIRSQRGEGKLKAIIVSVILAVAILAAWKMVPPYAAQYQLNDKITEIARFAVINHDSEDKIKDAVFKTMQDLEIPATREAIKVTANPAKVTILVDYTIPVDILFYHVDLHFTPSSEGKSLTAS